MSGSKGKIIFAILAVLLLLFGSCILLYPYLNGLWVNHTMHKDAEDFLGFDLQYVGVLLMYCNLLTAAFTAFAIAMLHCQILQEERYLTAAFGEEYLEYQRRVFRYLGRRKGGTSE